MDSQPDNKIVSVIMITYNHERYIRQAIEGVLMQEYTYPFELVIGEDFSNDNTKAICEDFANRYPHIIKLLPSEKNLGMIPNFIRTWQNCTGKYIALCEGDDYWTDPYKLQKQVDFLEANKKCNGVFHNVLIKSDKLDHFGEKTSVREGFYTQKDIFENNIVPTLSLVFRNQIEIPKWFENVSIGDWYLHLINTKLGPYYCLGDIMGVYRKTDQGVFSSLTSEKKAKIRLEFYKMSKELIGKELLLLRLKYISSLYFQIAKLKNNTIEKIESYLLSVIYAPYQIKTNLARFKALFL